MERYSAGHTGILFLGGIMEHIWEKPVKALPYEHCRVCGVVKRYDGKNGPCKGPIKITLRDEKESANTPGANRCHCADDQGGPCSFCMEAKYNL